ncbi:MAG: D-2-hydroxyacid dehydrogenase [Gammaproteobacteria bacterium]|jgi:glycerate dehydrogenase|nr:glycerate dehydrogenase [Chromatiales bacterium]MDP6673349.1 D-2-hydroxyacid dehydrogenase [Gammaproteobacteria bacterium]
MRSVFLDTDTLGPDDIDLVPLTDLLPALEFFPATPANLVTERIAAADIVLANKVRMSGDIIKSATNLKLICLAATGTDNIDLNMAAESGIVVSNIRNYCAPSVAQHVFTLILALTRRLNDYQKAIRGGSWKAGQQFCLLDYPIRELDGKTIGIIGFGSLGAEVGRIAETFGMHVLAARQPYEATDNELLDPAEGVQRAGLGRLLAQADIISLHCPLNPETENLIDTNALTVMRNDAILINTARGGLIDSEALITALQTGQIAGAGIDVLRQEPPVDPEPLVDTPLPNLIVTPHIAWAGRESRQRAVAQMAENIACFLQGNPRNNVA